MIKNALKSIDGYVKQRRQIKRWQKIVTCLAAVVVFVTTYAPVSYTHLQQKRSTENLCAT